jgi:hypothetical protein
VFDGRATQEPKDAAPQLQADLTRLYGSAIEWVDYFTKTPPGKPRLQTAKQVPDRFRLIDPK